MVFLPELDCSLAVFLSFFLFFGGWLQAAWMAGRPGDSAGVGGRVAGSMGEVGLLVTWVGYAAMLGAGGLEPSVEWAGR